MLVKITNAKKYTWYENKLDMVYEVKPCLAYGVQSHYVTLDTEKTSWPLYIDIEDAEVIQSKVNNHHA